MLSAALIPAMTAVEVTSAGLNVGGAATLAALTEACEATEAKFAGSHEARTATAIRNMLRWFASRQIRAVATLAGNVATASPISDMNPMLLAVGATLTLASAAGGLREVPMSGFFLAYRKVDMKPDEVIANIFIPHTVGSAPSPSPSPSPAPRQPHQPH